MIKAILFDMDGTLVDTENIDNTTALNICKNLGFDLTHEEQEERHGRTSKSFYEWLAQSRGTPFNVQKTIKNHLALFQEQLRKGVKSFPGAKELPEILSRDFVLAIVSGSTSIEIGIVLNTLGIKEFFKTIVSADDITESKPDPEGYLKAANQLGVTPEECIVIEDGAKGIQAAKSAGMKVIGVINNGGQDLSQANLIVNNLTEINPETLNNI